MINTNKNPVIYIHIDNGAKQALRLEAEKQGMRLTTYCRMLLLKSLEVKNARA